MGTRWSRRVLSTKDQATIDAAYWGNGSLDRLADVVFLASDRDVRMTRDLVSRYVSPLPAAHVCPQCGNRTVWTSRTSRTEGQEYCSGCELTTGWCKKCDHQSRSHYPRGERGEETTWTCSECDCRSPSL